MKPASVITLSLFLAASSSFAQNTSYGFGTAQMEGIRPVPQLNSDGIFIISQIENCPASLRVNFLPDGDLIKTGAAHPKGIGQALHLTFSNFNPDMVTEATLLLRGWTPKGRRFQTGNEAKPDAIRSQHIHLVPGPNQTATADIWIPGLSAITSVEIVSATFASGSAWTGSGNRRCSAAPDGFMLVNH